jgi:hypothetical protein
MSSSSEDLSNREGEEAVTPKKIKKTSKTSKTTCEKQSIFNNSAFQIWQILIGVIYFVVCLLGVLAHLSNYQRILESAELIVAKPNSL